MGELRWRRKIPIVTNPVVVRDLAFAFGIPGLLIALVLAVAGTPLATLLAVAGGVGCGLFGLGLGVGALMQLLGAEAEFWVGEEGVGYASGGAIRGLDRAALAAGLASGRPALTGSALLARSREAGALAWEEVGSVRVHRRSRTVEVRPHGLVGPLALFCTRENFEEVVARLRAHVPDRVRED